MSEWYTTTKVRSDHWMSANESSDASLLPVHNVGRVLRLYHGGELVGETNAEFTVIS
jgi:hypothetical protein